MVTKNQIKKLRRRYQDEAGKPLPGFERHAVVLAEVLRAMKLGYDDVAIAYAEREGIELGELGQ